MLINMSSFSPLIKEIKICPILFLLSSSFSPPSLNTQSHKEPQRSSSQAQGLQAQRVERHVVVTTAVENSVSSSRHTPPTVWKLMVLVVCAQAAVKAFSI
jgi:hypothetical protein